MIKVLFFTPGRDATGKSNVGDRVILAGVRNLVASAFGAYAYRELGRWSRLTVDPNEFDLIVYAGMPQYGARASVTDTEQRFDDMLQNGRLTETINIGGGTPARLPLDVEAVSDSMAAAPNAAHYRTQGKLRLRTTRDLAGKRYFDKIDMPCDLRPCPSFFSTLHLAPTPKTRDAVAALSDDTFVSSHVTGSVSDHVSTLLSRLPGFEAISHSRGDLVLLSRLGVRHTWFRTELDAIDYYATVGRLASLRIHAAVPSWTMGADVAVGGFDARINMFEDTGMPIPWANLLDGRFDRLVDMLDEPSFHLPLAERKKIIDAALVGFVDRLRETCPRCAELSSTKAEPLDGFELYPPQGRVDAHPGGRAFLPPQTERPPRFVEENDGGTTGCIVVPAGEMAGIVKATSVELPVVIPGRALRGGRGKPNAAGTRVIDPIEDKGPIAKATSLFLPAGRYRASLRADMSSAPGSAPFRISITAKSSRAVYGKEIARAPGGKAGPKETVVQLDFENAFPDAALQIDIAAVDAGRRGALVIHDLRIEPAPAEPSLGEHGKRVLDWLLDR